MILCCSLVLLLLVLVCLLSLLYCIYLYCLLVLHLGIHSSWMFLRYVHVLYLFHVLKHCCFISFLILVLTYYLYSYWFILYSNYAFRLLINVHHVHHDHHVQLDHDVQQDQYVLFLLKLLIVSIINSIVLLFLLCFIIIN